MTEPQDAPVSEAPREMSQDTSDRLKMLGFDPGVPVFEDDDLDFDLDAVKEALFGSTYRKPSTLMFRFSEDAHGDVELHMVVAAVEAYYEPYAPNLSMTRPLGCYEAPEWYLRGFLYASGFDASRELIQMHVYLTVGGAAGRELNYALVQLVPEPSGADPSTPLLCGAGIPAQ